MKLKDIGAVLTFATFRPEPDDRNAPWHRRFSKQKTLLLNIGKGRTSWKVMGKGRRLLDGGSQDGEFREIATSAAEEWRSLADDGWCAISVNHRYVISLETNVSRKPGAEDLIFSNPRAVLGARYERGRRYAFTNNPESASTILLSVEEEQIKQIEQVLRETGLKAGRICCGTYAMLHALLAEVYSEPDSEKKKEQPEAQQTNCLDVVCCEGSVCAMLESGDAWTELRSRSDLYKDGDFEPVFNILQPLVSRIDDDGVIRFVGDGAGSPIVEALRTRFPLAQITDYSREDQVWRVLADS